MKFVIAFDVFEPTYNAKYAYDSYSRCLESFSSAYEFQMRSKYYRVLCISRFVSSLRINQNSLHHSELLRPQLTMYAQSATHAHKCMTRCQIKEFNKMSISLRAIHQFEPKIRGMRSESNKYVAPTQPSRVDEISTRAPDIDPEPLCHWTDRTN